MLEGRRNVRIPNLPFLRQLFLFSAFSAATGLHVGAQSPNTLSQFFEGKQVTVKLDMPATQKGVDIYPDKSQPLDTKSYASRLKQFGIALRSGDTVVITKVKVKSDNNIEFQLGGGGYGTAGDTTDESVHFQPADKSSREKEIEQQLKTETDQDRRRSLSRELDDLRRDRERQDRRNRSAAESDAEARRDKIAAGRAQGGSRFNLRFVKRPSADPITPQTVMDALARYVAFPPENSTPNGPGPTEGARSDSAASNPPPAADAVNSLKKGMTRAQVEAVFGPPTRTGQRTEDALLITSCTYQNATETLQADFVNGVLVQYTVSSR